MRIPCPYCGPRDSAEFSYLGDARVRRPESDGEAMSDYVHQRDNPAGQLDELWYHASGCHAWLTVTRDTRTHEIFAARLVHDEAGR
jgi:heterotetrameric sarcosine oxidase delta subunit